MIFIDTSAFLARYIARDQYYRQAIAFWHELSQQRRRLFTSNSVLMDLTNLLGQRGGNEFAADKYRQIITCSDITILRSEEEHEVAALEYFEKYADQGVGFIDCISFVLMRHNRIKRVFTFDRHFRSAGFTAVP